MFTKKNKQTVHHTPYTVDRESGVGVIAAIIAVMLLASLGAGVAYLTSSGQRMRIQQMTGDQSFYTVQAGLEFGLGQILEDKWAGDTVVRQFSGKDFTVERSGGIITVAAVEQDAEASYSITDPDPPTVDCIITDVSGVYIETWSAWHLLGITVQKDPACTEGNVVITGMSGTTWEPNLNEELIYIEIGDASTSEFQGSMPSGGSAVFQNNFTMNNSVVAPLVLRWNYRNMMNHDFELHFQYTYNGNVYEEVATVSFLADNQAGCFAWNTGSGILNRNTGGGADWTQIGGTSVTNNCNKPLRIRSLTVSWTPDFPTRNFKVFRIWNYANSGSDIIFNGTSANGAETILDYTLGPLFTRAIQYFRFDASMLTGARNYSIIWKFSDNTTVATPLTLFASAENDCLTVNTANAAISTTDIVGLTIQNMCAQDIGITGIALSWAGEAARRFTRAEIYDIRVAVNVYTGSFASGYKMVFQTAGPTYRDVYHPNGIGVKNIARLRFNTNVTVGLAFAIDFIMADGTVKSVAFTPGTQASCLSFNDTLCSLQNSGRDVRNCTITNTCALNIVWAQSNMAWSPTSPTRTFQQMRVDNSNLWSGSASSGKTINHSDLTFTAGQTRTINWFRWNSNMTGRTFTQQFIMSDGTKKIVAFGPY